MFLKFLKFCFFAVLLVYFAATVLVGAVLEYSVWHSHLVRFIHRAWLSFVAERVGSTSPGFVNSIVASVVGLILVVIGIGYLQGLAAMRKHVIETAGMGIVGLATVSILVYGTQFAWDIVQFVYDDHQKLAAKVAAPVPPCPTCPSCPTCPPAKVVEQLASPNCWVSAHFEMPNSTIENAVTASAVIIHCNHKVEAPFRVAVEFDRDFIPGGLTLNDSGTWTGGGERKQGNVCFADVGSPSLLSDQIVVMTVYGSTDQYPRPLKAKIESMK